MAEHTWTCQRVTGGSKCGAVNPKRKLICEACGKRRPATKREKHFDALKIPYEVYVSLNGGEDCGICGRPRSPEKSHHRDHEHKANGLPRGLLCMNCNRALGLRLEIAAAELGLVEWAKRLAVYAERAERRRGLDISVLL